MRRIRSDELMDKFMALVYPEPNTGCWLWGGMYNPGGYGVFKLMAFPFKYKLAHRCSYYLHYGVFDYDNLGVCHTCDVPACVNPEHLFLGTQKDNVMDCVSKGRWIGQGCLPGEDSTCVKLTNEQVLEIRSLSNKINQAKIARKFKITQSNVSVIINRKTWKHL